MCRRVTEKQHQELKTKFLSRNRELTMDDQGDSDHCNKTQCAQYCQLRSGSKADRNNVDETAIEANSSKSIRIKPEQCSCDSKGCHAYVSLHQCGDTIDVISCSLDACKNFINEENCKSFQ